MPCFPMDGLTTVRWAAKRLMSCPFAQAAQAQKRAILEHAAKISQRLRVVKNDLEIGLQTPYSIATLKKPSEVPSDLDCGFTREMSQWLKYADDQGRPISIDGE